MSSILVTIFCVNIIGMEGGSMIMRDDREYLDELDKFLMSDDAPEECMMLSDLDGFLTGLACGPESVAPAEWMPRIWGDEPRFADEQQRLEMESAILRLYAEIVQTLQAGEWTIAPIFWQAPDGVEVADDWCEGFLDAIHLRVDAWEPLFTHRRESEMLMPILIHCTTSDGEPYIPSELTHDEEFMAEMPDLIAHAVDRINVFWRERELRPEPIRSSPRVGRNDPCPCGTGKKFKRCCGGGGSAMRLCWTKRLGDRLPSV